MAIKVTVHSHYFHPSIGGCQTFADLLAQGLAERGYVTRVVTDERLGSAREKTRDYEVVRNASAQLNSKIVASDVFISVGPATRFLFAALRARTQTVLVHQGPHGDCPIAIGWRADRECRFQPLKCLFCEEMEQRTPLDNIKHITRYSALRLGMGLAHANVFVSNYLRSRVVAKNASVIWNSFDESVFAPDDRSLPRNRVFTFVGRLASVKGCGIALRGFAHAVALGLEARLRIVGNGPEETTLRELSKTLRIENLVEFCSFVTGTELRDVYRSSWALLFPSQWEEPFGITMVEAMACGCPVIASNHGAAPEVVANTGLLVPHDNVSAWGEAMLNLADAKIRAGLAGMTVNRANRRFSTKAMIDQYEALLCSLLKNGRFCNAISGDPQGIEN